MKEFFKVKELDQVFKYIPDFIQVENERVSLPETTGRVLAEDIVSGHDLPDFSRSTMDGYAVSASSTFGASEGNPAYLTVIGSIAMGESPGLSIGPGETCRISTGGMLPGGSDSVVMIEHTEIIDKTTIEVYKSVAPGQHVVLAGEDIKNGEVILSSGMMLRSQETGLLAAFGKENVNVFKKPVVGIISTGDEVVPVDQKPGPGQIRDVNSYTLSGFVKTAGCVPVMYGIVEDDYHALYAKCYKALNDSDVVLISGGSSVGTRDFTIDVLSNLPDAGILVHGVSISPGKPTILARAKEKAIWGLPGHIVSAMVVFKMVVQPFIEHIAGISSQYSDRAMFTARLSRNLSSAQGRTDFVRVRLNKNDGKLWAEPILGKSGLINTMVKADGLIKIDTNTEGLDKGTIVEVIPLLI